MTHVDPSTLIALGDVTPNNLKQLKVLNSVVFPIQYQESFYTYTLESKGFTKLAYFNDVCVGCVVCKIEQTENKKKKIYIMTLGVLAAYRKLGVGRRLLQHVLDLAEEEQQVEELYLHVHTENQEALGFYQNHGFSITSTVENYYPNHVTPTSAYIVSKMLAI